MTNTEQITILVTGLSDSRNARKAGGVKVLSVAARLGITSQQVLEQMDAAAILHNPARCTLSLRP